MNKLSKRKDINFLVVLCSIVYFASYVSRINLGTVLVEIINSGYASEKIAALALSACSVTYGAGQLVSGYLGDKFKPQNIILIGFIITSLMNLCVGTVGNESVLVVLWAINGFAQAFMWPPLVKILSNLLSDEDYKKACVRVSWGSSLGTVSMYLLSPLMIKIWSVKAVFIFSGVFAAVIAVVWKSVYDKHKAFSKVEVNSATPEASDKVKSEVKGISFDKASIFILVMVMLCILLQGSLRDGVTNWTPTYISDIFNLDSSISILSSVILPIFSLLSFTFVSFVNRKFIKNELVCAGVTFGVGAVSAVLLMLVNGSMVISLLLLALLVGSMHGVNLILVCVIPAYFAKFGKVSFISGLINSCTYAGAAISTYGIAVFTESFGWNKTIVLWSAIAFLGAFVCIMLSKKWSAFKSR